MQLNIKTNFEPLSDKEIVDLVIAGNEEAILYLLYDRYIDDLRFYAWRYYDTLEYLEDLISYLYIQLKGKDADWQPLRNFQWRSKFRTWFDSVASHLFYEKRRELIDLYGGKGSTSTDDEKTKPVEPEPVNPKLIMILEAISRLENEDYRFILIKELEGYNHTEIAQMMAEKRKQENIVTYYGGEIFVPSARYVDMTKARALKEVKKIVNQVRKEWYENK